MKRAMVFIDFDNLNITLRDRYGARLDFDVLLDAIKESIDCNPNESCSIWGNCYYNYERNSKPSGMFEAHKRGLTPVYVPSFPAGTVCQTCGRGGTKSLCDPMLICDAMEALYKNRNIDIFVLVASDKDYLPFLRKIAENGKEAIVIGIEHDARTLVDECNRAGFKFLDYGLLLGFRQGKEAETKEAEVVVDPLRSPISELHRQQQAIMHK